jgi:hypothetical protein
MSDFLVVTVQLAVIAIMEGFALEQTLQAVKPSQTYFWAVHAAAELDLSILAPTAIR